MARKFGYLFRYAFNQWVQPIREEFSKYGIWTLIRAIPTYYIMYRFIGLDEMSIEVRILVAAVAGWAITEILRYLWFALNAPFSIIKEQDNLVASFEKIADRNNIIASLTDLWVQGTALRNKGEALMHESRVEPWWNEHLEWRNITKSTISLLDSSKANQWWTLGMYTATRDIPQAFNNLHKKRIQMFDAWLERLNLLIKEFQETKSD